MLTFLSFLLISTTTAYTFTRHTYTTLTLTPHKFTASSLFAKANKQHKTYNPEFLNHGQTENYGNQASGKTKIRNKFSSSQKKQALVEYPSDSSVDLGAPPPAPPSVPSPYNVESSSFSSSSSPSTSSTPSATFTIQSVSPDDDNAHDPQKTSIGLRIDAALHNFNPKVSRTRYSSLLKQSLVTVNEVVVKKSYIVQANDVIKLFGEVGDISDSFRFLPEDIPLDILYEDDVMIVVNKAANMVVHPGAGNWNGTLVNAMLHHFQQTTTGNSNSNSNSFLSEFEVANKSDMSMNTGDVKFRPGVVHRLDKDTTGAIIVAKKLSALTALQKSFSDRTVKKTYLAITIGNPGEDFVIDKPIGRHPINRQKMRVVPTTNIDNVAGKSAISYVRTLGFDGKLSFVEVKIVTGRTHQIRVHLSDRKTPIYGDDTYGNKEWNTKLRKEAGIARPLLHCYEMEIEHPVSGEIMKFTAPLPCDMGTVVQKSKTFTEEQLEAAGIANEKIAI